MSQNMQNPGGQAGALRDLLSGGRSPHLHIASDSNEQTLREVASKHVSSAREKSGGRYAMTYAPFANHREAALALLNCSSRLTRKAGQFLGQLVADPAPLSNKQSEWLEKLLVQAGLPPMAKGVSE